jgi:serine/threonine protein kinase
MSTFTSEKCPRSVGPYQMVERIGRGGMGSVYRAINKDNGGVVAVKILKPDLARNPTLLGRFLQEFRSTIKLDHPNIVRALDAGTDGVFTYLVMEFVEGQSLGKMLSRVKKLPEGPAVRIITQIAQGLHYAHLNRVIHRDVKPDNILVRSDGLAKLADFGLAKDIDEGHGLTRSASTLGTPHFMAPEQYTDAKRVGIPGDVYSLGATLYTIVTGRLPFGDCSTLTALAKKVKGEITSPRQIVRNLSEQVDIAIRQAMSPDLAKRPANCLEFVKMLPSPVQWEKPVTESAVQVGLDHKPTQDRRASARRQCVVGATCVVNTALFGRPSEALESWPGVIRDVSSVGIGVILARRFEPGTILTVETNSSFSQHTRLLLVRVVRVKDDGLGYWKHGCKFITSTDNPD